jgi:hypothetical protein
MTLPTDPLQIGILLPVADLYHRLWSDINEALLRLAAQIADRLHDARLNVF